MVMLLCLLSCAAARDAGRADASQSKPPEAFQKATETGAVTSNVFDFELSGFSYHIATNGNGRRTKGEEVLFKELPVYNVAAKTVVVNRKTGKIIRIE